jgi:hypothetical protein
VSDHSNDFLSESPPGLDHDRYERILRRVLSPLSSAPRACEMIVAPAFGNEYATFLTLDRERWTVELRTFRGSIWDTLDTKRDAATEDEEVLVSRLRRRVLENSAGLDDRTVRVLGEVWRRVLADRSPPTGSVGPDGEFYYFAHGSFRESLGVRAVRPLPPA